MYFNVPILSVSTAYWWAVNDRFYHNKIKLLGNRRVYNYYPMITN